MTAGAGTGRRPERQRGRRRAGLLPGFAALGSGLWFLLFFLAPLAFVWVFSFGRQEGLVDIELAWTLDNYLRALDPLYLDILLRSIWLAGLTAAVSLALGLPVAVGIAFAPARWKPLLLLLVALPFLTNLLIRTYALIAVLRTKGYVNAVLGWAAEWLGLPFEPLPLLYNDAAVVIGLVYVHMPFMVLPLYAALERMDRSLIEAALDLGASRARAFWTVVVPAALPGVFAGTILVFIPALGSYLTPDLLGGADSQMIANVIERQFKRANDWPFGAALSLLLIYAAFGTLALRPALARRWRGPR